MNIKKSRRMPIISVNSMSDIAFLLLIFIMLISLINYRKEIKIEYPEAKFQETTQADTNFEVWVDVSGNIYHKGMIIDLASLEILIAKAVTDDPKVRIHVIADRGTKYRHVSDIIEILKLIQHRSVSFVVRGSK